MKTPVKFLLCAILCMGTTSAAAQLVSGRPVQIVVPVPPGGANDVIARLVAAKLQESLGQSVIVVNKPGANQVIGTDSVAKAAADGHTLLLTGSSAMAVNPALNPKLAYDPLRDFAPISMIGQVEMLLAVNPSVQANSVSELVARAKADPQALMYGAGTTSFQLAVEMFKQMSGASLTYIPYTGGARATTAVLAGEVQVIIIDAATALPQIRAGKLKALAGMPRVSTLPDLPDIARSVPGYEMSIWLAMFAPKGTSAAVVTKLNGEVARIVQLPDMRERMLALGVEPGASSPEQLSAIVGNDIARFRTVIQRAGMKAE
jgi:tripartite-type tricarboxylate transporter receptor subunit TctC